MLQVVVVVVAAELNLVPVGMWVEARAISTCLHLFFRSRRLLASQLSTATGTENVTIPREYLHHLLKKEHMDDYNGLPVSPSPHINCIKPLDHIEEDRFDESYFQQAASLSEDDERMMSLHPAAKGTLREFIQ